MNKCIIEIFDNIAEVSCTDTARRGSRNVALTDQEQFWYNADPDLIKHPETQKLLKKFGSKQNVYSYLRSSGQVADFATNILIKKKQFRLFNHMIEAV